MSKMKGIVKFYNSSKGFGFLREDNSENEVFVHATGLIDQIQENDQVEYEVTQGKKGLNAINVKVIN